AATRARYSTHLADCDDCRAQVVVLARAAGVAERLEERSVVAATHMPSWRERLAALFAPGTWRYALPFVALLVVSGGVLWVMSGARRERANTASAPTQIASSRTSAEDYQHAAAAPPQDANTQSGLIAPNTDNYAEPRARHHNGEQEA